MNIDCEICGLKFPDEMIIPKKFSDFSQCYDCLYFMNFNDTKILNGSMGYDLKKYIEISSKYHLNIPCNNFKNNSGCYVCMTVLNIPFDFPKNEEIKIIKEALIINEEVLQIKKENKSDNKVNNKGNNINIETENFFNIIDSNYVLEQEIIINL